MDEAAIRSEVEQLTKKLEGKYNFQTTLNSMGEQTKRIIIEYDFKVKGDD